MLSCYALGNTLQAEMPGWFRQRDLGPTAFTCALLNSQPMGFYGPAPLVQNARRHGVEVRPVDVGDWDCTLEGAPPALRLGLRMVQGLSRAGAERIAAARPFGDVRTSPGVPA